MTTGGPSAVEVRPRSAGEVLDDAWDLALADAPFLLLLNGLFQVPAFVALLVLLSRRGPDGFAQVLLPALVALLLPLTGLGSGACQELLRLRAEGRPVRLGACLRGALRRGPEHVAARAALLPCTFLGLGCLLMPGLGVWAAGATVHALLAAGKGGLEGVSREAATDPGKAGLVTLVRLPLLLLAAVNGHLLVSAAVWAAANFVGLDVALLDVQLALGNPVYVTALVLFCWLLLGPYFEASNFLLFADGRTRREGLDLLFRVQRVFAVAGTKVGGAAGLLLALLLCAAPVWAQGPGPRLSRDEIKGLLRPQGPDAREKGKPSAKSREERPPEEREVERDDTPRGRGRPRSGAIAPQGGGGLGTFGWVLLAGVALAVLGVAGALFLANRGRKEARPATREEGRKPDAAPPEPLPHEQPAGAWWRRAEELARAGRHPEAVRALFWTALSALHAQGLLRCEPSRTNHEYVRQVRLAAHAPDELHEPFERLTERFEAHWYGGADCAPDDYRACRALADEVQALARQAK